MSDNSQNWKVGAKQKFLDGRQPSTLKEIKVDEWQISVYYWPAMNANERSAIGMAFGKDGDTNAAHVAQLIARARDEHGRPLFAEREREDLMTRYDPEVIARISSAMITDQPNLDEAEKNS